MCRNMLTVMMQENAYTTNRSERETIHSGHFMVSYFDADAQDDEYEVAVPVPEVSSKKVEIPFRTGSKLSSSAEDMHDSSSQIMSVSIETSLTKLFQCMTIAYRQKLTSPKWNRFKGVRLRWKDKIRLNNVIWRCWHMQFVIKKNTGVCQFACPLDVDIHSKPEAVVLEGKYWKRKLNAVTAEYKKWRLFYRNQMLSPSRDDGNFSNMTTDEWNMNCLSNESEMMMDEDYMEFMSDTLFSSITGNQSYTFPDYRDIARGTNLADLIQPSLAQLQPNLEEIMDTLEPLQDLLSSASKLPSVPEEYHTSDDLYHSLSLNYHDVTSASAFVSASEGTSSHHMMSNSDRYNIKNEPDISHNNNSLRLNSVKHNNNNNNNNHNNNNHHHHHSSNNSGYHSVVVDSNLNIYQEASSSSTTGGNGVTDCSGSSRQSLDCNSRQSLDCNSRQSLDCNSRQSLDCNSRQSLDCNSRQSLDCNSRQSLDCNSRQSLDCGNNNNTGSYSCYLPPPPPSITRINNSTNYSQTEDVASAAANSGYIINYSPHPAATVRHHHQQLPCNSNNTSSMIAASHSLVGNSSMQSSNQTASSYLQQKRYSNNEQQQQQQQILATATPSYACTAINNYRGNSNAGHCSSSNNNNYSKLSRSGSLTSNESITASSTATTDKCYANQKQLSQQGRSWSGTSLMAQQSNVDSQPPTPQESVPSSALLTQLLTTDRNYSNHYPYHLQQQHHQQQFPSLGSANNSCTNINYDPRNSVLVTGHRPVAYCTALIGRRSRTPDHILSSNANPVGYCKPRTPLISSQCSGENIRGHNSPMHHSLSISSSRKPSVHNEYSNTNKTGQYMPASHSYHASAINPSGSSSGTTTYTGPFVFTATHNNNPHLNSSNSLAGNAGNNTGNSPKNSISPSTSECLSLSPLTVGSPMRTTPPLPSTSKSGGPTLYKEHRRVCHINAEQKRRCNIKNGFDTLHLLIPQLAQNPNTKMSKAAMLQKGAEYIRQLRNERSQLQDDIESLKQQIESLNSAISNCQSLLPATGAPVSRHRATKMKEMFHEYVKERTKQNWKFWILSLICEPLLSSFNASVSTANVEELFRTTIQWAEQYCSLVDLRPIVLNALRQLCTTTEILSDPARLPDEVRDVVLNTNNEKK